MRIAPGHLDSAVAEYALQPEDVSALHHVLAGQGRYGEVCGSSRPEFSSQYAHKLYGMPIGLIQGSLYPT
jgi:hypothetical protein